MGMNVAGSSFEPRLLASAEPGRVMEEAEEEEDDRAARMNARIEVIHVHRGEIRIAGLPRLPRVPFLQGMAWGAMLALAVFRWRLLRRRRRSEQSRNEQEQEQELERSRTKDEQGSPPKMEKEQGQEPEQQGWTEVV